LLTGTALGKSEQQSIQIARRRANRLCEAILAKQAEFEAESEFEEDDKEDSAKDLFNGSTKWEERYVMMFKP